MNDLERAEAEQAAICKAIAKISKETNAIYRFIDLEFELGLGSHDLNSLAKVARPMTDQIGVG